MSDGFRIRRATTEDIEVIADQRAKMFVEMGRLPPGLLRALVEATARYLETALPDGEYVGWLALSETGMGARTRTGAGTRMEAGTETGTEVAAEVETEVEVEAEAATPADRATVVAGAGLQRRRVLPHPMAVSEEAVLAAGRQGIILNVYTEPLWRRRGLAELLVRHILDWAPSAGLETIVLHASEAGRPIYERLGFVPTNEMRFVRDARPGPTPPRRSVP